MKARARIVLTNGLSPRREEMTDEESRRLALEFVQDHRFPVSGITAVRRIRFDHPTEGPRDLWVVCFATRPLPGHAEFTREIIVEVRDDTGEVRVFGSAQPEEPD